MNTTSRHFVLLALWAFIGLTAMLGCQKKCQQAAPQRFRSVRETTWRLIETDDPGKEYRNLNRFSFLILEFSVNFRGTVKKVENNDQFDTPILTFQYNVRPEDDYLVLKYSRLVGEDDGTGQTQQSESEVGTVGYYYELTNELVMYHAAKGYYYRYVPFQGVVDPDSTCVF